MNLKVIILANIAKFLAFASKLSGKGRGTSLPGLWVETRFPEILKDLGKGFEEIIFISGTNGKTTTRAILTEIYRQNKMPVCSNLGGANILRGIASSLLLNLDFRGRPRAKIAIFEVEEASLPKLSKFIKPSTLILTNIFRDQLDAYGEIDRTLQFFVQTLENLNFSKRRSSQEKGLSLKENITKSSKDDSPEITKVILNIDDPKLIELVLLFDLPFQGYGLDIEETEKPDYEKGLDPQKVTTYLESKNLATNILARNLCTSFTLKIYPQRELLIESRLPGIFNIYNILAALLASYDRFQELTLKVIKEFEPVFGRGEKIKINNNELTLFLVKNPAGFNQALKLINANFPLETPNLVFLINDKIADGKDVSWLWDVDFENFWQNLEFKKPPKTIQTGGSRGLDLLLRLEYAGFPVKINNYLSDYTQLILTLEQFSGKTVVFCTYTALLEFRKEIGKKVKIKPIDSRGF